MLFSGVLHSNYSKLTKINLFLFISNALPALLKHALTTYLYITYHIFFTYLETLLSGAKKIWTQFSFLLNFFEKAKGSHWMCSLHKGVLKNFTNFTVKHPCWSLFLRLVRPVTLKRGSNTDTFLWNLQSF